MHVHLGGARSEGSAGPRDGAEAWAEAPDMLQSLQPRESGLRSTTAIQANRYAKNARGKYILLASNFLSDVLEESKVRQ